MVKSLLLGIAAGLVAISGASAADFTKAKPVQYVKVASLMYTPAAPIIGANGFYGIAAMQNLATFDQPGCAAKFEQAMNADYTYLGAQSAQAIIQGSGVGVQDKANMAKTWASGYGELNTSPSVLGQQSAAPALHAAQVVGNANIITRAGTFGSS